MFFDSHAHLAHLDDTELDAVLRRAVAAGVDRILAVGGCPEANGKSLAACARYPDVLAPAIGLDRDQASRHADTPSAVAAALAALRQEITAALQAGVRVAALGEVGLDFHYSPGPPRVSASCSRPNCAWQGGWGCLWSSTAAKRKRRR